jgi:hypothetical protein
VVGHVDGWGDGFRGDVALRGESRTMVVATFSLGCIWSADTLSWTFCRQSMFIRSVPMVELICCHYRTSIKGATVTLFLTAKRKSVTLFSIVHRHRESIDINLPFSVHLHYYPMISPPNIDIFPSPLLM